MASKSTSNCSVVFTLHISPVEVSTDSLPTMIGRFNLSAVACEMTDTSAPLSSIACNETPLIETVHSSFRRCDRFLRTLYNKDVVYNKYLCDLSCNICHRKDLSDSVRLCDRFFRIESSFLLFVSCYC